MPSVALLPMGLRAAFAACAFALPVASAAQLRIVSPAGDAGTAKLAIVIDLFISQVFWGLIPSLRAGTGPVTKILFVTFRGGPRMDWKRL